MPRKKKKSSEKNARKKAEQEVLRSWAENPDKISAKALAKKLPDVADKMRGNQEEERAAVTKDVLGAFLAGDGTGTDHSSVCPGMDEVQHRAYETLVEHIVPDGEDHAALRAEFVEYMVQNFGCDGGDGWLAKVRGALKHGCDEFESRIVRECYNGDGDLFFLQCAYYLDASDEEFTTKVAAVWTSRRRDRALKEATLTVALQQVEKGFDKTNVTCWNCGKQDDCVQTCSLCSAARYCGRKCQRSAWNEGHQDVCPHLKDVYACFQQEMSTVKAAIEDPDEHEVKYGVKPCPLFDYPLVENIFQYGGDNIMSSHGVKGPSMSIFYGNLRCVFKSQFWFQPHEDVTGRWAGWRRGVCDENSDHDLLLAICSALSFDYSRMDRPGRIAWNFLEHIFLKGKPLLPCSEFCALYVESCQVAPRVMKLRAITGAHKWMKEYLHTSMPEGDRRAVA